MATLSARVDLTENNDFSRTRNIPIMLNNEMFREFHLTYNTTNMSFDEYERLMRYEGIFGKKRHFSQVDEVFNKEGKCVADMKGHCQRCGKLLRMPWKSFYGLCSQCDEDTRNILDEKGKFPWYTSPRVMNRDTTMDIFRMR